MSYATADGRSTGCAAADFGRCGSDATALMSFPVDLITTTMATRPPALLGPIAVRSVPESRARVRCTRAANRPVGIGRQTVRNWYKIPPLDGWRRCRFSTMRLRTKLVPDSDRAPRQTELTPMSRRDYLRHACSAAVYVTAINKQINRHDRAYISHVIKRFRGTSTELCT